MRERCKIPQPFAAALRDTAVLLRGGRHDNAGRGELIAVETASFGHSERLSRDSARLYASVAADQGIRFYRERGEITRFDDFAFTSIFFLTPLSLSFHL